MKQYRFVSIWGYMCVQFDINFHKFSSITSQHHGTDQDWVTWYLQFSSFSFKSYCSVIQRFFMTIHEEINFHVLNIFWIEKKNDFNFFCFFSFSILQKNGEQVYDKCHRYAVDWKIMLKNVEIDSLMPNESWPIESCDRGWEYNKTDVQSSIVIDVSRSHSLFYSWDMPFDNSLLEFCTQFASFLIIRI